MHVSFSIKLRPSVKWPLPMSFKYWVVSSDLKTCCNALGDIHYLLNRSNPSNQRQTWVQSSSLVKKELISLDTVFSSSESRRSANEHFLLMSDCVSMPTVFMMEISSEMTSSVRVSALTLPTSSLQTWSRKSRVTLWRRESVCLLRLNSFNLSTCLSLRLRWFAWMR